MTKTFKFNFFSVVIPIILGCIFLIFFGGMMYFGFNYKSDKVLIDTTPVMLILVGLIMLIFTFVDAIILVDFIKKSLNLRIEIDKKNALMKVIKSEKIEKYRNDQIVKIENYESPNANTISSYIRFMKIMTDDNKTHQISSLVMDLNDLVHLLNIDNNIIENKRRKVFQKMPVN